MMSPIDLDVKTLRSKVKVTMHCFIFPSLLVHLSRRPKVA